MDQDKLRMVGLAALGVTTTLVIVFFIAIDSRVGLRAYAASPPNAPTVGTTFSYQGFLTESGGPATGLYDFEFKLYDDPSGGTQIGSTASVDDLSVVNGLFTTQLNFGNVFDGSERYLEIGVRAGASVGAYETLAPRQHISAAPYALYANNGGGGGGTAQEAWRLGVSVDGSSTYTSTVGRAPHLTASYRSNAGVSDIYFIFPASADQRTIQDAEFYILNRSGTYGGTADLSLEILDFAGTTQHTATAAAIDVASQAAGSWTSFSLSGVPADLVIEPGEILVAHVNLSAGPSGDLDVRTAFEIEVTP